MKDTKLVEKEQLVVKGSILADEFRDRVTGKLIVPAGYDPGDASWVDEMKELISVSENNEVIINDLIIPIYGLLNDDEDSYFPDLTDQAGKVVVVNQDETGFEYGDGGTKLYRHYIVYTDSEEQENELNIISLNDTEIEDVDDLAEVITDSVRIYDANGVDVLCDADGNLYAFDPTSFGKILDANEQYTFVDTVTPL